MKVRRDLAFRHTLPLFFIRIILLERRESKPSKIKNKENHSLRIYKFKFKEIELLYIHKKKLKNEIKSIE